MAFLLHLISTIPDQTAFSLVTCLDVRSCLRIGHGDRPCEGESCEQRCGEDGELHGETCEVVGSMDALFLVKCVWNGDENDGKRQDQRLLWSFHCQHPVQAVVYQAKQSPSNSLQSRIMYARSVVGGAISGFGRIGGLDLQSFESSSYGLSNHVRRGALR